MCSPKNEILDDLFLNCFRIIFDNVAAPYIAVHTVAVLCHWWQVVHSRDALKPLILKQTLIEHGLIAKHPSAACHGILCQETQFRDHHMLPACLLTAKHI